MSLLALIWIELLERARNIVSVISNYAVFPSVYFEKYRDVTIYIRIFFDILVLIIVPGSVLVYVSFLFTLMSVEVVSI